MVNQKYAFILLLIVVLLGACTVAGSSGCDQPPKSEFSELDLVGTWGGGIEHAWDSLIVIRSDGRYKQIINVERTGFQYENDWQQWRVTYSEHGLPYLHLDGLLMCAYWWQMDCTGNTGIETFTPSDTKDPFGDPTYWYDFCQEKWIDTPGEGVFMVMSSKRLPRGIELVPFTKSPDGNTGPAYQLHESDPLTITPVP